MLISSVTLKLDVCMHTGVKPHPATNSEHTGEAPHPALLSQ